MTYEVPLRFTFANMEMPSRLFYEHILPAFQQLKVHRLVAFLLDASVHSQSPPGGELGVTGCRGVGFVRVWVHSQSPPGGELGVMGWRGVGFVRVSDH